MRLTSVATFALAVVGGTLGFAGAAAAADLPEYPVFIDTPEPLPLPSPGGWYLRGDIGYKIYSNPDMSYTNAAAGYTGASALYNTESLDDTAVVGVGAGYTFNEYFRMDATIDYEFKADGSGRLVCIAACAPVGYSVESYELDAWTGLVNAYVDLGTYGGLTPYVGGGIGASYLTTSNVRFVNGDGSTGSYSGDSEWNFAWALTAGAAYAISDNLLVDLNYRYVDLGDARTGLVTAGGASAPIRIDDITAHEIRVGLRYNLY